MTKATEYCPNSQITRGKVIDIHAVGGRVSGVKVAKENGDMQFIATNKVVLSPGPMLQPTLDMLRAKNLSSDKLPIFHELHARVVFDDPKKVLNSKSPLTFDSDPPGKLQVLYMQCYMNLLCGLLDIRTFLVHEGRNL